MASSSGAPAAGLHGDDVVEELKTKLYELCRTMEESSTVFRQDDLLALNVIPNNDVRLLLQITQRLCDEKLFKLVRDGSAAGWMYRTESDAAKYRNLNHDQEMVYGLVDEAGTEGIWSKTIKTRSGLHDTAMRAAIKALEGKRYIMDMKSVEHLNRKMYIKASLKPNEKATGGPWYTDGELDEDFIEAIQTILYNKISDRSFYKSSNTVAAKKPKRMSKIGTDKVASAKTSEAAKALRDAALDPKSKYEEDGERSAKRQKTAREPEKAKHMDRYLPLPAGYQGYPTLQELTRHVENSNVTDTTLTKEEISQLLDVLCFDKKIEKVVAGPAGVAYRALRRSAREIEDGPSNALTEAPCGRCPVFDLCEEGGPVAPSNCEYFRQWLEN